MKKIIGIIILTCIVGCSSATWEDGTGKKITYRRLGTQELSQLEVNMNTGMVKLGGSKGSAGDIAATLKNLSEVAKSMAK